MRSKQKRCRQHVAVDDFRSLRYRDFSSLGGFGPLLLVQQEPDSRDQV
jgi:hypothetical protein